MTMETSRLTVNCPDRLEGDQAKYYEELDRLAKNFFGTSQVSLCIKDLRLSDSAFIGPFGAMIHTSHVGRYLFGLTIALSGLPGLPVRYREIAILVVGARFKAPYETYAHSRVGSVFGLPQEEIDEFVAGSKPKQLSDSGAVAYDVAHELVSKAGPLNEEIWLQACKQFGKGAIALVHYNGYYMYTCTVLNGFNIAIPDGA